MSKSGGSVQNDYLKLCERVGNSKLFVSEKELLGGVLKF